MRDSNPYPDTVSDAMWKNASTKEREFLRQHEEQHRKRLAIKQRRTEMATKLEEAMKDYWGERCSDHEAECPTCQAWGEYDHLTTCQAWVEYDHLRGDENALWDVQLEEFPDSIRCSRQEVMNAWILQGTTQFKADPRLQHGILNALLNAPTGVFYTCHDGQDYGYRYGSGGSDYYSFYVEVRDEHDS